MKHLKQTLSVLLLSYLVLTTTPAALAYQSEPSVQVPVQEAKQTAAQLQQLVAPIALYPDALVAQILAGSTYPDQVVEADRWIQQNPDLKGDQLGQKVDQQPWDPSIKALTEFPSVLGNMDKNLSWTSSVGDVRQSATGCDERRAGDAPARREGWEFGEHLARERVTAGADDCDRTI